MESFLRAAEAQEGQKETCRRRPHVLLQSQATGEGRTGELENVSIHRLVGSEADDAGLLSLAETVDATDGLELKGGRDGRLGEKHVASAGPVG